MWVSTGPGSEPSGQSQLCPCEQDTETLCPSGAQSPRTGYSDLALRQCESRDAESCAWSTEGRCGCHSYMVTADVHQAGPPPGERVPREARCLRLRPPSVTRRWKSRAGLGSVSWATSLGCPEGCLAPPTSEPLTGDHQPLVSTAPVSGSSFPASEPLMSPAHRYLSLRSQSDAASSGTPSPLCPPCPEQGRAQEAGAEGIRMEQGHNRAGAVVTAGPQDAPGLHPRRYPQPQVGGGLNSADFPSFCN